MNRRRLPCGRVFATLAGVLALASCSREGEPRWRAPRPVRIVGAEECFNYSRSYMAWGSTAAKGRPAGLLAADGDILGFEKDHAFRYRATDGSPLAFKADETGLRLGESLVALTLSKKDEGWNWLKGASAKQLAGLRFVSFDDDADFSRPLLEKLAAANPRVGLLIHSTKLAAQVLPLFHPRVLLGGDFLFEPVSGTLIPQLDQCEFLATEVPKPDAKDPHRLLFLGKLPLRSVVLLNWRPEGDGPIPTECRKLRALSVVSEGLKDLSALGNLAELQELRLNRCEKLADVSGLAGFGGLKELSLAGCERVRDLAPLKKLPKLESLSLPPNVTQGQLAEIVADHPDLRVLELAGCKEITDLGPLRALRGLEALVLIGMEAGRSPRYGLKGLRLLVLDKEAFEKSEAEVKKLEEALPDCLVVAGEGMCLGSGWLLLVIPLGALAFLFNRPRPSSSQSFFSARGRRIEDE